MPRISVIINTLNRPDALRLTLNALAAQSLPKSDWEVIVVDDGSPSDVTERVARAHGDTNCHVIRREHGGRAAARNSGIFEAQGEWALFLGDDVLAAPDLLERHLKEHKRRPGQAIVGHYEWNLPTPSLSFRRWVDNLRFDKIRMEQDSLFRYFYTGNASVPLPILREVDGFDENFTLYGWEDMDLGLRLEKAGLRIRYVPLATAEHHHPEITLEGLCRREYEMAYSLFYYCAKWPGEPLVQEDLFWKGDPLEIRPGSAWRKKAGQAAIRLLEHVAPFATWPLDGLYDRLLWSCRYEGLRDGARRYGPLLEQYARGELTEPDLRRRFQGLESALQG